MATREKHAKRSRSTYGKEQGAYHSWLQTVLFFSTKKQNAKKMYKQG